MMVDVIIEIGPVARQSAVAWIDYAGEVMADLRRIDDSSVSPEALEAFSDLLDRWRALLNDDGPFDWIGDESPDRVEYLMRALYHAGLAIERESQSGRARLRPEDADEFHMALVGKVMALLHNEGESYAQFVENMRAEWGVAGLA